MKLTRRKFMSVLGLTFASAGLTRISASAETETKPSADPGKAAEAKAANGKKVEVQWLGHGTFQLANKGATYDYHGIKISMVGADHSSGAQLTGFEGLNRYMGQPVGYVMAFENGFKIYHSGDTGLMADMQFVIGDYYQPDLAILPIGDVFTMGPREAAHACKMIRPAYAIPEHYATFPVLVQSPDTFVAHTKEMHPRTKVLPLKPGGTASF